MFNNNNLSEENFILNYINDLLEIDFENTTEEESIDSKNINKLCDLWNNLNSKKCDISFFKEINTSKKNINKLLLFDIFSKKKINYEELFFNKTIFTKLFINYDNFKEYKRILEKYIFEINNICYDIEINIKRINIYISILLWIQKIVDNNISYNSIVSAILISNEYIHYYKINNNINHLSDFINLCNDKLNNTVSDNCYNNKLLLLFDNINNDYPRSKFFFIYNRLKYLLDIRYNKNNDFFFPYEKIKNGYAIFDILLYIIYINNIEYIDQDKQNFLSLLSIYIKFLYDIIFIEEKNNYLFNIIDNGLTLDTIIIKLINLNKILYFYLKESLIPKDKRILNIFLNGSQLILTFAIYKNKNNISKKLFNDIKSICIIDYESFKIIENELFNY